MRWLRSLGIAQEKIDRFLDSSTGLNPDDENEALVVSVPGSDAPKQSR